MCSNHMYFVPNVPWCSYNANMHSNRRCACAKSPLVCSLVCVSRTLKHTYPAERMHARPGPHASVVYACLCCVCCGFSGTRLRIITHPPRSPVRRRQNCLHTHTAEKGKATKNVHYVHDIIRGRSQSNGEIEEHIYTVHNEIQKKTSTITTR